MKKIILITLIGLSTHITQPTQSFASYIIPKNILFVGATLKGCQSLYSAAIESFAMKQLYAEGKTARAEACQQRRTQHTKNALKAAAFGAAVYSLSNDHLHKGITILSMWNVLNTFID